MTNSANNPTERATLLIIDDNDEILDFLSDDLSDTYHILTALDGWEALKVLNNHPIQLIVSDIMMPRMDGYQLCNYVKSNFEISHIPIILLTAKNTLQARIEGLNQGADAYIEKPFSPEHLKAQITSLLLNRNRLKDFFAQSPLVHIKTMAHTKMDEQFLEKMNAIIHANLSNNLLDVEFLAHELNMSKPTLYRKIKSISNLSPNEMINLSRLKKAAELIAQNSYRMHEIADIVGYNSLTQLGRNFQKQFGTSPSEYQKKLNN